MLIGVLKVNYLQVQIQNEFVLDEIVSGDIGHIQQSRSLTIRNPTDPESEEA